MLIKWLGDDTRLFFLLRMELKDCKSKIAVTLVE